MNRIRRLVGLQTVASGRLGGWIAPAAVVLAAVTAFTAVGLARPVAREHAPHHGDGRLAEVREPDVVSTLEALDAREAALMRLLRDAGLDDGQLILILEALDADPWVLRAVKGAGHRPGHRPFLGGRLHRLHEEIEADLAAGRITEDEARQRLDQARHRMHEHMADARLRRLELRDGPGPGERLRKLQLEIEQELAAGRITEAEARERLEQLKAKHLKRIQEGDGRRRELARMLADRVDAIRDEIRRDLEEGLITEEEAQQRLHEAMQRLHERIATRMHGRRPPLSPELAEKMQALHESIERDLAAGVITEQEARERLEKVRQELHEHFRSEMAKRHRERGGPPGRHRHREHD